MLRYLIRVLKLILFVGIRRLRMLSTAFFALTATLALLTLILIVRLLLLGSVQERVEGRELILLLTPRVKSVKWEFLVISFFTAAINNFVKI